MDMLMDRGMVRFDELGTKVHSEDWDKSGTTLWVFTEVLRRDHFTNCWAETGTYQVTSANSAYTLEISTICFFIERDKGVSVLS